MSLGVCFKEIAKQNWWFLQDLAILPLFKKKVNGLGLTFMKIIMDKVATGVKNMDSVMRNSWN